MPEDVVEAPQGGDTPAPAPDVTPSEPAATPEPAKDFESIAAETKRELEAVGGSTPPAAKKEEDKPADNKPAEPAADDDEETEDKKDDEPGGDKPAEEEPAEPEGEKTVAEQVLELMKNPEMLERALREAGVETIQDLPFVKDFVGRQTQAALDKQKAAQAKEVFEKQAVDAVLERGRAAAGEVVSAIEKLAQDIEDGAEEFKVPETEYLVQKFNEYADGAVHAYHNKNFGAIAEGIYEYPEMKGINPAEATWTDGEGQTHTLAEANGQPPAVWMDAHLQVARQNLWNMAQNAVAQRAEQIIEDRTKALEEAHKLDIQKLTETHEKALAKAQKESEKAMAKAKEDTRAEVLAEFASKGSPPRVPSRDSSHTIDEDEISGSSIEEIWASAKKSLEKSGV